MWTEIIVETYVPEGFADNGWAEMNIYIDTVVCIGRDIEKLLAKIIAQMEVTRIGSYRVNYVKKFEPEWYTHLYNVDGQYSNPN